MSRPPRRRRNPDRRKKPSVSTARDFLLPALLVALTAFVLYLPSLRSGFVYDAEAQILTDTYIHDPSHLTEVITFQVLGRDVLDFNRPVHLLSLMGDSLLWGKQPAGYHLTSNLLHALNAGMLCLFLLRLLAHENVSPRRITCAVLPALLFAIHPVSTEVVAEVSYREDLLATGFLLLAMLAALGFAKRQGWRAAAWGSAAVTAIFLACASKETGATGPFLLAACWLLFYRDQPRLRWVFLVTTSALATGGFFLIRHLMEPQNSVVFAHQPDYLAGTLAATVALQPRLWTFLLANIAWPTSLSADYMAQNIAWISLSAALGVLTAVVGLQIWLAFKSRLAALGALVFWLGLAPVSNFVPLYRPLADRFLYLPMVGVALTLAGILATWPKARTLLLIALAVCFVPLTVLNLRRQTVFASSLALWTDTLAKSPFSHTAANNLGYALLDAADYDTALESYQKAWDLTGGKKADAAAGAAIAQEKLGHSAQAETILREAIRLDARYADPDLLIKALIMPPHHAATLTNILQRLKTP